MKIRTKLRIAAVGPVLLTAVIGAGTIASYRVRQSELEQSQAIRRVVSGMNELNSLVGEYIVHHDERPKQQFLAEYDVVTRLLDSLRVSDEEQRDYVSTIRNNIDAMGDYFAKMTSMQQGETPGPGADAQLAGQLRVKARQAVADASRLERLVNEQSAALQKLLGATVLLSVAGVTLLLAIVLAGIVRGITGSLDRLRKGAEILGAGDLSHRFNATDDDEFGELARHFDRTAEQLSASTVSRNALAAEVKERKWAEEQAAHQREWLRVTLTSIGDAVLATDTDARITFLNPLAAALTGWTEHEALGRSIEDVFRIIDEQTRQPGDNIVARVLREGTTVALADRTSLRSRDGREIPIEDSAAPIMDADGQTVGVVLVFYDVTARRRTQAALAQSEERYRSLFTNMSEGFSLHEIITDSEGRPCDYRFLELNPAFERQTGLKRADLIDRRVLEVMPGTESHWIESFGRVALTGEPTHFENYSSVLGRWYEVHAYQPAPRQFAVIFADITDRKHTEDTLRTLNEQLERKVQERTGDLLRNVSALQEEVLRREQAELAAKAGHQRLYDVLDTLPAYVILLSTDHRVPFANRFFEERFKPSQGRKCYEYLFGRREPCETCETFKVLETGQPHHWEWTGPDGRDYDIVDLPFADADGSPMILEMGIDITQRKQAEAALRQRTEQLRALASELTLAEHRERRRLAKVLHDHLQQLLVAAKFRTAILGRNAEPLVQQATVEIQELLDESIRVSRSLTGELSPPVLHDGGLAAGMEWLARWMTDKHGLIVDLTIDAPLPQLDEHVKVLLFESVRELLFNAVKHAHVRTVTVNLRQIDQMQLQIMVSDTGAGFDPATVKRVGEVGIGFGLFSICERLDLIGGQMQIESAPGAGSRFTLTAPATQVPVIKPSVAITAAAAADEDDYERVARTSQGSRIRVMLADDHGVVREGLARLLEQEPDLEVVGEASDGQQAVEMAGKLLPDVILMDLDMPSVNGVEATRAIHKDYPEIRIIGLSMFNEAERAQAVRDAGATGYLTKSGPSSDLVAAIRNCVRAGQAS